MKNLKLKCESEIFRVFFDPSWFDDIENNFSGQVPSFIVDSGCGIISPKNNKKIKVDIQEVKDMILNINENNTYVIIINGNLKLNGKTYDQWQILKKEQHGRIVFDDISDNLSVAIVSELQ